MVFDGWAGLVRVAVVGTAAYVALVLLLRISGKRTLSKMNAFDLVVTVALGSTLATILLSTSVALAEGLLALALLIFLQFAVTWISVRSATFRGFIKNEPKLLFYDGGFLQEAMRAERMTEGRRGRGVGAPAGHRGPRGGRGGGAGDRRQRDRRAPWRPRPTVRPLRRRCREQRLGAMNPCWDEGRGSRAITVQEAHGSFGSSYFNKQPVGCR